MWKLLAPGVGLVDFLTPDVVLQLWMHEITEIKIENWIFYLEYKFRTYNTKWPGKILLLKGQFCFLLAQFFLGCASYMNIVNVYWNQNLQIKEPSHSFNWTLIPNVCKTTAIRRSEWLLFNTNSAFFSAISWREQVNFQWDDDDVSFVLDQHTLLDF